MLLHLILGCWVYFSIYNSRHSHFFPLSNLEVLEPSKKRPAETTPAEDKKARKIQGQNLERQHKHRIQTWNEPSLKCSLPETQRWCQIPLLRIRSRRKESDTEDFVSHWSETCSCTNKLVWFMWNLFRIRQGFKIVSIGFVLRDLFLLWKTSLVFWGNGADSQNLSEQKGFGFCPRYSVKKLRSFVKESSHAGTPMWQ